MFAMVDTAFSYGRALIARSPEFFKNLSRLKKVDYMKFEMQILRFIWWGRLVLRIYK